MEAVAPQLYEQDKLSEELGQHFSTLCKASSAALARGAIDLAGFERGGQVNYVGHRG